MIDKLKMNTTALICVLIDQLSKIYIIKHLSLYETREIIKGFFSITYVHNTGAAFSLFDGKQILFSITAIAIIIAINIYIKKNKLKTLEIITFGILSGGIIGNLIDRLFKNHVIDFLDFNFFGYNFPVFNIADICICLSTFILIILTLGSGDKHDIQSN